MLIAKPVVPERYWLLRDGDRKVGNIQALAQGYRVQIHDRIQTFTSVQHIQRRVPVDFEPAPTNTSPSLTCECHGFPTTSLPYNSVYDLRLRLPLWTREPRSRSWYAAGWYSVRIHNRWRRMFCPKLILLQRYHYQGPFASEQEIPS